ncbi:dihydroxyacetone kinase, DhaK subunit [Actinomyces urogenitalis DSM 15434]|uniref:Dihydroxyacetone kinase, DhaK subunit n=3 Tax=Actinomyces urogenitalis TaxID=103621 RepID=C0W3K4_9ACTO|nr:dihydroxyacetone kinase subunit DhaK [Actinomyces urogenitalis]EEH66700.1 dihydroxyacetone kinase, DhaK subunit [Actinomyces urogenitalis DSM 15434]KGF03780.1 dihydroxyacetone kinase [Actinomyces urogenitalis S6-C4]MBS5976109.1 dihydroxyacetone kinase subunit DhaK [Actinomyces urogenitalis]MBS6071498.1 dihydroxyacetone kinase subunit DhaK [Actinomyces urogenitalis]MDK8236651.1 dihydroxyacetone kinase subunit DhaK [Actinomyces urogenitalis]
MKKLINDAESVVADALAGLAAAHPDLVTVDLDHRVVYRASPKKEGRVAVISGGGSGHEPLHCGFVGPGMLDAACAGEVFTSPVPDQVVAATKAADRGAGVLHVVKNYTGDVMNFEMAAELVAMEDGPEVATVVVADDVAVEDSLYTTGRRGVGTTLVVEKVAGAAAEAGASLGQVQAVAQRVADHGRSMGVALSSCTVPANGRPSFDLPEDEIEIGIGIHGEPGRRRAPMMTAKQVAAELVAPVLAELPDSPDGHGVIAVLDGMGATPLLELYLMYGEVKALLDQAGVVVERSLVGSYVTSLDMAGCALTLVRADEEVLRLWDAPVRTAALTWTEAGK